MTTPATITLLIFKRVLFKTKNSRIHEPPNNIESYRFYLAFSKKKHLKSLRH
jgi:hypothetical protein